MACEILFDEDYLVVSAYYFTLNLYSLDTGQLIFQFTGHTASITCFDFIQNLNLIVSGSADCTTKVWSMSEQNLIKSESNGSWPTKISILERYESSFIVILYTDGVVNIRNVKKLNDELNFTTSFNLDAKSELNQEDSIIYLSNKSRFSIDGNILTGFFISENNSNETIKFFVKKWAFREANEYEYETIPFDNSFLEFLNKFRLLDIGQFNIIAFGLK